jgi:hypothetical protein
MALLTVVALSSCRSAAREPISDVVPFAYRPVGEASISAPDPSGQRSLQDPDPPPLRGLRVRVMQVPSEVPVGGRLRYLVELRNSTRRAIELDPCPAYYSAFGESSTSTFLESYLNCGGGLSTVPARGSLRFAMEIEIPDEVFRPGDRGTVYWRLPAARPSKDWHDSSDSWTTVTEAQPGG